MFGGLHFDRSRALPMSSCLVVQHIEPEGPYAIGDALVAAGIDVVPCRTYAGEPVPGRASDFDGLVVMGGPMSAVSDAGFPTRRQEIALVADALDVALPTLGVCLGSQLLAVAAGGRVMAGRNGLEVGWAPVRFDAAAADDPFLSTVPTELTVLHWHGDTYELPPEAVPLASSASYAQQAFRVGDRAWGLQFHVEVDQVAVDAFVDLFGDDVLAAGTTPEAIRAATPGALAGLVSYRHDMLARFAALVAAGDRTVGGGGVDQLVDRS
ncbi:MAG TPA: type 1 glutamine amidotransferase [Acidimicrobiales bacterium]|jgi:GMP synthase-like glutamine amidotransferase